MQDKPGKPGVDWRLGKSTLVDVDLIVPMPAVRPPAKPTPSASHEAMNALIAAEYAGGRG